MKKSIFLMTVLGWLLAACTDDRPAQHEAVEPTAHYATVGRAPHPFAIVDDNIEHDTLLTQVTFDLGDSTYMMVASHMEGTFEGLRLYRYRFAANGAVESMAVSSPAYDSWTMLPTFFPLDTLVPDDAMWILANFGERESWGQKLLWLDWDFTDMGFMDIALVEHVLEDSTLVLKRQNIGPKTRMEERNDTTYFRFACDSVFLYDDQAGNVDQVVPARTVYYTFHREEGLAIWVNGQKHLVKKPA